MSLTGDGSAELVAGGSDRPARFGVCGTPSSMTHWGIHVVRVILGAVAGDHGVRHGNYAGDFDDLAASGHRVVVCTSDCPEVALCRSFAAVPSLVFAEEPTDVIDDLVAGAGVGAVDALRLAVRSLCALQPLLAMPTATVFGKAHLDAPLRGFVDRMLAALDIVPTAEQRGEIDRHLGVAGPSDSVRDHVGRHFPAFAARIDELARGMAGAVDSLPGEVAPVPPGGADLVRGDMPEIGTEIGTAAVKRIAHPYRVLAQGGALAEVEWPASIFSSGDDIGAFVAGPAAMIGPARIMVYGPYMHLPPGCWTARIEMEVADNASGNRLKVDLVGGPRVLVSAGAEMPMLGQYAFTLDFVVSEPLDPLELRFQIESGAIEGRFLLRRVLMTLRPSG